MKLKEFKNSQNENFIAINPIDVSSVEGNSKKGSGTKINMKRGDVHHVTENYSEVLMRLSE